MNAPVSAGSFTCMSRSTSFDSSARICDKSPQFTHVSDRQRALRTEQVFAVAAKGILGVAEALKELLPVNPAVGGSAPAR
jgi:hypothetical protein